MGAQRALGRGRRSAEELDAIVVGLVDRLARRMRTARRVCRTVVLRLRFDDFSRATRSRTMTEATARTATILLTARALVEVATPMIKSRGLTLIGVALTNLGEGEAVQLPLPLDQARASALDATVDDVRDRFGTAALTRAVLLGHDPGWTMPMLPD
jgi:DNA polymerase-4